MFNSCVCHNAIQHIIVEIIFLLSTGSRKIFLFYYKYGYQQFILFVLQVQELLICLCCLPMSESLNCTHIIDGIDLLFSCCIYFIQHWASFNSPSSVDIFAMISYCLFTITCYTCGKPPVVSIYLQHNKGSSNCFCICNETSDCGTSMAVMVTVYSLAFSSIYLL